MKKLIFLVAAMALSSVAMAGPSWTYVDAGYVLGDSNDNEFTTGDTDGYSATGSLEFFNIFHAGLGYGSIDFQDNTSDRAGIVLGIHPAITDSTDVYAEIGYTDIDNDTGFEDGDALSIGTGVRTMIADKLELSAGISYTDVDIDNTESTTDMGFNAGGQYFFTDNLGLGVQWTQTDVVDTDDYGQVDLVRLYVRWSFGGFGLFN
jgi:hypothetical protein